MKSIVRCKKCGIEYEAVVANPQVLRKDYCKLCKEIGGLEIKQEEIGGIDGKDRLK